MLAHTISGAKLRAYRERAGRSVQEVARDAHLSADYLYKLEKQGRQPSRALAGRLAAAVGVAFKDLLADEDSADPSHQKAVA